MAVTVGNIVRLTAKLLLFGVDDIVNVFHFRVLVNTSANDTVFMAQAALALDSLYVGINAFVSDNCSYISVEGQNVTDDELLPSTSWPTLTIGGDVDSMLPEMNSICVFHRTLKPRVRASKFLPPTAENQNLEGAVSVAAVALAQTFGDTLTADLTGVDIALRYVAFNRTLGTSTDVTQAIVPARFRTQRGRRIGVGS